MPGNLYNIFYTDDDADDQEVFRDIVAEINEDIYIFTQSNGSELVDLLKNPPPSPHLIFLDLNMPVKNGYEVLREIRHQEGFKDYPVIIFSTSTDEETIALTKTLGATLYISKPGSYNDLKRILREVLAIDWEQYKPTNENFVYRGYIAP